jgi:putative oxidoreductase
MRQLAQRAAGIYDMSRRAKETRAVKDAALLAARIALAWIFVYNGSSTLFGAFGGPGIHRASIFYGTVAHLHPAVFFTVLGGVIEFFGGIAVGLGLFGRIAALGLTGDMAIAIATVTWSNGIASNRAGGGYELNLALAALACVIALMGTGRYSLDYILHATWQLRRQGIDPSTSTPIGSGGAADGLTPAPVSLAS